MRLDQVGLGRVELGREGFGSVWTDGRINIEPVPVPVSVPAPDFNIDDCEIKIFCKFYIFRTRPNKLNVIDISNF